MADSAEFAFVKNHLNTIGSLPVQYSDDYQQPSQNSLRKIPIIPVDLPPPPAPKVVAELSAAETITLTIKVAKPARSYAVSASPAETIAVIKSIIASQAGAPPADAQRLLLRGKALADGKLLKEYTVKDGDTVNLMLKPGFDWDWSAPAPSPQETKSTLAKDGNGDVSMKLDPGTPSKPGRHGRIPSVVLSPSPSTTSLPLSDNNPSPITLNLDTSHIPTGDSASLLDAYHQKLSSPEFWLRLYDFLKTEFVSVADSDNAFESFLVGSKGDLSPSEIAKIRDTVGIVGMNGS